MVQVFASLGTGGGWATWKSTRTCKLGTTKKKRTRDLNQDNMERTEREQIARFRCGWRFKIGESWRNSVNTAMASAEPRISARTTTVLVCRVVKGWRLRKFAPHSYSPRNACSVRGP